MAPTWRANNFRSRQRVRQSRIGLDDKVLVEEHGSRHMSGCEFRLRITVLRRQIPGPVDNRETRLTEPAGKPAGIDDKAALFAHFPLTRPAAART